MKLFVLGPDLWTPQPVWMNIFWPHYRVMAKTMPTVFLPMPTMRKTGGRILGRISGFAARRTLSGELQALVRSGLSTEGPNILLVYALNARDVQKTDLLDDVWQEFDHRVLLVVDTLQPEYLKPGVLSRFDLILSYCADSAEEFTRASGVPSMYFPPHGDILAYHCLSGFRPIDLLLVGRRDARRHTPIHRHFNRPDSGRLSLDFVTRTQTMPLPEEEFGLLMSAYARSKIAFCFEPSDIPRFRGRSPLTGRWLHAWTSGCTVVGKAPTGSGAAEQMDWPDSTLDLPEDETAAIEAIEAILSDEAGLDRRRRRNVFEALRRHDTRRRLKALLDELGVAPPASLLEELARLDQFTEEVARSL